MKMAEGVATLASLLADFQQLRESLARHQLEGLQSLLAIAPQVAAAKDPQEIALLNAALASSGVYVLNPDNTLASLESVEQQCRKVFKAPSEIPNWHADLRPYLDEPDRAPRTPSTHMSPTPPLHPVDMPSGMPTYIRVSDPDCEAFFPTGIQDDQNLFNVQPQPPPLKSWHYDQSNGQRQRQRWKQVLIGQATAGWARWRKLWESGELTKINGSEFGPEPCIPNIYANCSKRFFDTLLRQWRRFLHQFDEGHEYDLTNKSDESEEVTD
eukprot:Sspe_Gene.41906::Locus_20288_Transcript_5_6_Confidence_0.182_Length_1154::g.41906::m.41906